MNEHAYWLAAAVVGLAGCAGNPEPVKVPQKKAESGCFLNCEIPCESGQAVSGWYLPGDLVRVERVNSRARADYSKFGPQSRMVMERSGRMASRYGELYRQLSRWVANGAILPISPSTASAWRSLAVPTAWATCSSPATTRRCWRCAIARTPSTSIPSMPCPTAAVAARAGPRSTGGAGQPGLELGYSKSLIDNFPDGCRVPASFTTAMTTGCSTLVTAARTATAMSALAGCSSTVAKCPGEQMSEGHQGWANRQPEESVKSWWSRTLLCLRAPSHQRRGGGRRHSVLPMAAVAADKTLLPMGTPILAEVPLLDKEGNWTGKHQLRLLIALDVGAR